MSTGSSVSVEFRMASCCLMLKVDLSMKHLATVHKASKYMQWINWHLFLVDVQSQFKHSLVAIAFACIRHVTKTWFALLLCLNPVLSAINISIARRGCRGCSGRWSRSPLLVWLRAIFNGSFTITSILSNSLSHCMKLCATG